MVVLTVKEALESHRGIWVVLMLSERIKYDTLLALRANKVIILCNNLTEVA